MARKSARAAAVQMVFENMLGGDGGEDTLRGLFLRDLKAQYDGAEDEQLRRRIAQAARFGLAAMEGRECV